MGSQISSLLCSGSSRDAKSRLTPQGWRNSRWLMGLPLSCPVLQFPAQNFTQRWNLLESLLSRHWEVADTGSGLWASLPPILVLAVSGMVRVHCPRSLTRAQCTRTSFLLCNGISGSGRWHFKSFYIPGGVSKSRFLRCHHFCVCSKYEKEISFLFLVGQLPSQTSRWVPKCNISMPRTKVGEMYMWEHCLPASPHGSEDQEIQ